ESGPPRRRFRARRSKPRRSPAVPARLLLSRSAVVAAQVLRVPASHLTRRVHAGIGRRSSRPALDPSASDREVSSRRELASAPRPDGSFDGWMSILKVARIGHPAVRAMASPIAPDVLATAALQRLIDDMRQTMYEYEGVGLAAPQVHESLRLAVLE